MSEASCMKRERILDAAVECFARYGFRRTSMDILAQAVGMSRPALYQHFTGKEDVFRAMVRRILDVPVARAVEARESGGPLGERLYAALIGLIELREDPANASLFRAELLEEITARSADLVAEFERRLLSILEEVIAGAPQECAPGAAGMSARDAAVLLFYGTKGLSHEPASPESGPARLHQFVAVAVRGLEP